MPKFCTRWRNIKKAVQPLLLATISLVLASHCFAQQSDTVHYEYDRLNRVTKITYDSSGAAIIYTYDAAGNRTATTVQGSNLPPVLTSLNPASVPAGTHGFTFGVNGDNLVNGAVVRWNGSSRTTTYFGSFVTIDLTDADLATAGDVSVSLVNAAPGNVVSNALIFSITSSSSSLRIDSVDRLAGRTSGGQTINLTGAFPSLSTVTMGGVVAQWSYPNGPGDTSSITVTTPPHSVGAVSIDLTPSSGTGLSKPNAFAYLPTVFTDDTLVVGVTTAQAQHIIELRQAIDVLRAVAGLTPAPWTDAGLAPVSTVIRAVHIQELRTYFDDAATRLGYSTQPYTDPALTTGFFIKRVHIEELRQRIRAIAG
ncbi:MAG TPA: hypothetical protein VK582_08435 [Pyrinomonadaceae bacterium]|nr:hypothetical protein [Pyrinomonadaceae bacterium]